MARRHRSHYKVSGKAGATKTTTYTLSGAIRPGLAALIAADFVAAWQEEMEARNPTPKGEPRIRPQKVIITINL
jgi:hypothetical protein